VAKVRIWAPWVLQGQAAAVRPVDVVAVCVSGRYAVAAGVVGGDSRAEGRGIRAPVAVRR